MSPGGGGGEEEVLAFLEAKEDNGLIQPQSRSELLPVYSVTSL